MTTRDSSVDTFIDEEDVVNRVNPRMVNREGAFLLQQLTPAMSLLDVGCGEGGMAVGFAQALNPGLVTGIDIDAKQIAKAKQLALSCSIKNLSFKTADVYALPFDNNHFDAILVHNVMMHLNDVEAALSELYRVCKPGGVIGVREGLTSFYQSATFPATERFSNLTELLNALSIYRPGCGDIAMRLKGLLHQQGFLNQTIKTFSDVYEKKESITTLMIWAQSLLHGSVGQLAVEHQLITEMQRQAIIESIVHWPEDPAALSVVTWIEYIAYKE